MTVYDERYATPAPVDAWRTYDIHEPDPGYFQFDWLSARHPDLYHAFAVSSVFSIHHDAGRKTIVRSASCQVKSRSAIPRARGGIRTRSLCLTRALLHQLSYPGSS